LPAIFAVGMIEASIGYTFLDFLTSSSTFNFNFKLELCWSFIDMNEDALKYISGQKQLEIIPGATHLFEEPGALEKVALLASQWFKRYLTS
jgi:hypothetical protein